MMRKSDLAYKKSALQIVGPEKSNPQLLRQTDGERFFVFIKGSKFLREIASDSDEFVSEGLKTFALMDQRCDHVSSQIRVVCDSKMVIMTTLQEAIYSS
jgi:hypothetical protein